MSLYAANILILVAMALFIAAQLRALSASGITVWSALAFILSGPLATRTVVEFRPDLALGLASAMMVLWLIRGLVMGQVGPIRAAACMFGAALLIKPTFFAHTLALAAGLFLLAFMSRVAGPRIHLLRSGIGLGDACRFIALGH